MAGRNGKLIVQIKYTDFCPRNMECDWKFDALYSSRCMINKEIQFYYVFALGFDLGIGSTYTNLNCKMNLSNDQ